MISPEKSLGPQFDTNRANCGEDHQNNCRREAIFLQMLLRGCHICLKLLVITEKEGLTFTVNRTESGNVISWAFVCCYAWFFNMDTNTLSFFCLSHLRFVTAIWRVTKLWLTKLWLCQDLWNKLNSIKFHQSNFGSMLNMVSLYFFFWLHSIYCKSINSLLHVHYSWFCL